MLSEEQAINEVNQIMALVDIDRNGQIDYTEFILATMDKKKSIEKEKIQASFLQFDSDKNGYIELEELKAILGGPHKNDIDEQYWK